MGEPIRRADWERAGQPCPACAGTGRADGPHPEPCPDCRGTGRAPEPKETP